MVDKIDSFLNSYKSKKPKFTEIDDSDEESTKETNKLKDTKNYNYSNNKNISDSNEKTKESQVKTDVSDLSKNSNFVANNANKTIINNNFETEKSNNKEIKEDLFQKQQQENSANPFNAFSYNDNQSNMVFSNLHNSQTERISSNIVNKSSELFKNTSNNTSNNNINNSSNNTSNNNKLPQRKVPLKQQSRLTKLPERKIINSDKNSNLISDNIFGEPSDNQEIGGNTSNNKFNPFSDGNKNNNRNNIFEKTEDKKDNDDPFGSISNFKTKVVKRPIIKKEINKTLNINSNDIISDSDNNKENSKASNYIRYIGGVIQEVENTTIPKINIDSNNNDIYLSKNEKQVIINEEYLSPSNDNHYNDNAEETNINKQGINEGYKIKENINLDLVSDLKQEDNNENDENNLMNYRNNNNHDNDYNSDTKERNYNDNYLNTLIKQDFNNDYTDQYTQEKELKEIKDIKEIKNNFKHQYDDLYSKPKLFADDTLNLDLDEEELFNNNINNNIENNTSQITNCFPLSPKTNTKQIHFNNSNSNNNKNIVNSTNVFNPTNFTSNFQTKNSALQNFNTNFTDSNNSNEGFNYDFNSSTFTLFKDFNIWFDSKNQNNKEIIKDSLSKIKTTLSLLERKNRPKSSKQNYNRNKTEILFNSIYHPNYFSDIEKCIDNIISVSDCVLVEMIKERQEFNSNENNNKDCNYDDVVTTMFIINSYFNTLKITKNYEKSCFNNNNNNNNSNNRANMISTLKSVSNSKSLFSLFKIKANLDEINKNQANNNLISNYNNTNINNNTNNKNITSSNTTNVNTNIPSPIFSFITNSSFQKTLFNSMFDFNLNNLFLILFFSNNKADIENTILLYFDSHKQLKNSDIYVLILLKLNRISQLIKEVPEYIEINFFNIINSIMTITKEGFFQENLLNVFIKEILKHHNNNNRNKSNFSFGLNIILISSLINLDFELQSDITGSISGDNVKDYNDLVKIVKQSIYLNNNSIKNSENSYLLDDLIIDIKDNLAELDNKLNGKYTDNKDNSNINNEFILKYTGYPSFERLFYSEVFVFLSFIRLEKISNLIDRLSQLVKNGGNNKTMINFSVILKDCNELIDSCYERIGFYALWFKLQYLVLRKLKSNSSTNANSNSNSNKDYELASKIIQNFSQFGSRMSNDKIMKEVLISFLGSFNNSKNNNETVVKDSIDFYNATKTEILDNNDKENYGDQYNCENYNPNIAIALERECSDNHYTYDYQINSINENEYTSNFNHNEDFSDYNKVQGSFVSKDSNFNHHPYIESTETIEKNNTMNNSNYMNTINNNIQNYEYNSNNDTSTDEQTNINREYSDKNEKISDNNEEVKEWQGDNNNKHFTPNTTATPNTTNTTNTNNDTNLEKTNSDGTKAKQKSFFLNAFGFITNKVSEIDVIKQKLIKLSSQETKKKEEAPNEIYYDKDLGRYLIRGQVFDDEDDKNKEVIEKVEIPVKLPPKKIALTSNNNIKDDNDNDTNIVNNTANATNESTRVISKCNIKPPSFINKKSNLENNNVLSANKKDIHKENIFDCGNDINHENNISNTKPTSNINDTNNAVITDITSNNQFNNKIVSNPFSDMSNNNANITNNKISNPFSGNKPLLNSNTSKKPKKVPTVRYAKALT